MYEASEKQIMYIGRLYESVKKNAANANEEKQKSVMTMLGEKKDILAKALSGECSSSDARSLIDTLKPLVEMLEPSDTVKWRKLNGTWVIVGKGLETGKEVTVQSSKGEQQVVVGEIVETGPGGIVFAIPQKDTSDIIDTTGFYYDSNGGVIEAYKTKNGFLVARRIENGKRGEYLGQRGLQGLGDRLTLDELNEIGRNTGICCICSKELTDPESISRGMGSTCASKMGGY